jgi:hypothetical protein
VTTRPARRALFFRGAASPGRSGRVRRRADLHSFTAGLDNAIVQLSTCTPEDLPDVVHAIHGTLGSYRLDEAHAAVAAMSARMKAPAASAADAEAARQETLETLRRVASEVAS